MFVGARRSSLKQLELDRSDAAADLEHGPSVNAVLADEVDKPLRVLVEALASVALCVAASDAIGEELVATLCRAATHLTTHPTGQRADEVIRAR